MPAQLSPRQLMQRNLTGRIASGGLGGSPGPMPGPGPWTPPTSSGVRQFVNDSIGGWQPDPNYRPPGQPGFFDDLYGRMLGRGLGSVAGRSVGRAAAGIGEGASAGENEAYTDPVTVTGRPLPSIRGTIRPGMNITPALGSTIRPNSQTRFDYTTGRMVPVNNATGAQFNPQAANHALMAFQAMAGNPNALHSDGGVETFQNGVMRMDEFGGLSQVGDRTGRFLGGGHRLINSPEGLAEYQRWAASVAPPVRRPGPLPPIWQNPGGEDAFIPRVQGPVGG